MFNLRVFLRDIRVTNILLIISIAIMFTPVFYGLATDGWKSADYDHGIFIMPIALWMIWRRKKEIVQREGISVEGACVFVMGIIMYLYAGLNGFMFLYALSVVMVFWGIFWLKFTVASLKALRFPLSYLMFLVPPPGLAIDTITLPLKKISTIGSYGLLKIFQIPVAVSGAILKVGTYELFIADACSGFRSISTLLALGAVYAYFQNTSLRNKWIIFISVIPLGILGNIIRITLTGMISYFIGTKYAEGFFHEASGGVLFVFTVVGLIGVTELIVKKHVK